MLPNPIEGPWEEIRKEIQAHEAELSGHRVKLTILPDKNPITLDVALVPLLEAANNLNPEEPKSQSARKSSFAEGVVEKFRKQGFSL